MLYLCTHHSLSQGRQSLYSHKQAREEHRFDLSHKMSNLVGSRTDSKRVLQFPVGQKKWEKVSSRKMQQWCTGRARSSLEKMDMNGEGGGTDNKMILIVLDDCFSLA